MAFARVGDAELIDKISRVFRQHGYEGATMSRLSAATGLERASLYHRFPGGKDEMVAAAAAAGGAWFGEHVLQPLSQPGALLRRSRSFASGCGSSTTTAGCPACSNRSRFRPAARNCTRRWSARSMRGWRLLRNWRARAVFPRRRRGTERSRRSSRSKDRWCWRGYGVIPGRFCGRSGSCRSCLRIPLPSTSLSDQLQSRAEEFVEVFSGGFVLFYCGLDGFERCRALVAEVD